MSQLIRSNQQLAVPTPISPAFEDAEAVLALAHSESPYKTLAAVHKNVGETSAGWFRNFWIKWL